MYFQSVEAGESLDLESLVTELASCLNSLSENLASNASDDEQENDGTSNARDDDHENDVTLNASDDEQENGVIIQVLDEILKFLSSPQIDQVTLVLSSLLTAKKIFFMDLTLI